jgi:hypothetical protein
MTITAPRGARALLFAALAGALVAMLGAGLLNATWPTRSDSVAGLRLLVLWLLASGWVAMANAAGTAMRRLLLLLAAVALLGAVAAWHALTAGPPAALPATRAAAENAQGLSLLVVLGQLVLAGTVPALLGVLAVVLAALAWVVGRTPRRRRVPRSEMSRPR